MNRYAQTIVREFMSKENRIFLHSALADHFNDRKVSSFLNEHLNANMRHFAGVIEQELAMSDPMPGVSIMEQLTAFNNQFIHTRVEFIKTHVLKTSEHVPLYVVNDGLPTSRHKLRHHQKTPDNILKSWLANSGRGVQAREDPSGDITGSLGAHNPYYGKNNNNLETGIMFCDQSQIGTQNHVELYENTSYKYALNRGHLPHEETVFGMATAASDERLLNRRVFRSNEAGVEGGIPRYESRLYNRYLERDISETLRGAEKDYILHGHDMSSIHRRIDHKNRTRAKYQTSCDQRSRLQLQHNTARLAEDMRYC